MTGSAIRSVAAGVLVGAGCLSATPAGAEPIFLSKQYTRCTACHVSPTGGGLLSPYGRSLSGRELSLTGNRLGGGDPTATTVSGENAFLWGVFGDTLGPVQLGVELRPSHIDTRVAGRTLTRDLFMNADLMAAAQAHGWTFYGEIGRQPTSPGWRIDSYEHWVGYESTGGLGFRLGRFLPAYGVRFADHTSFNRTYLGFDKYDQVYGVELSRAASRSLLQVTLSPGLAESFGDGDPTPSFNAAARWQLDLGSSTAVAVSGLYRDESSTEERTGAGGVAFGFAPTRRLTVWSQGDVRHTGGSGGTAFLFVNETSFEAVRGLWLKVSPQVRTEAGAEPELVRWAFSAVLLPRTHWNVIATYYHDEVAGTTTLNTWLLQLHMYL
jgi:hypothetical protein